MAGLLQGKDRVQQELDKFLDEKRGGSGGSGDHSAFYEMKLKTETDPKKIELYERALGKQSYISGLLAKEKTARQITEARKEENVRPEQKHTKPKRPRKPLKKQLNKRQRKRQNKRQKKHQYSRQTRH